MRRQHSSPREVRTDPANDRRRNRCDMGLLFSRSYQVRCSLEYHHPFEPPKVRRRTNEP